MPELYDIVLENLDKLDWSSLLTNESVPFSFFMEYETYFDENETIILCSHPSVPLSYIYAIFEKKDIYDEWYKDLVKKFVSNNKNIDVLRFLETNSQWIDWSTLSANPEATWIVEKNPHKIDFEELCKNEKGGYLLIRYVGMLLDLINNGSGLRWDLSINPSALPLLQDFPELIHWTSLALNKHPDAISLFEKHSKEIDDKHVSQNPSREAMRYLLKHSEKIDWSELSANDSDEAIDMLLKNPEKINWDSFSKNKNPRAIPLFEANVKKLNFINLSGNPNAIHILEANPEIIDFERLSQNPNPRIWERCGPVLK